MPPKKTSSGAGAGASSAGRTSSKRSAGLAQPMLAFRSRKPTGSPLKGAKGASATTNRPTALGRTVSGASNASATTIDFSAAEDDEAEEEIEEAGDEAEDDVERVLREKQQARAAAKPPVRRLQVEAGKGGREHLDVKDKRWSGAYKDAVAQMGGLQPIHAGPETNNLHHILRVFDMTSKYGPYVGISRLKRWERAQKWGLNPPEEVKLILTTIEGENDPEYRENVLHSWLG